MGDHDDAAGAPVRAPTRCQKICAPLGARELVLAMRRPRRRVRLTRSCGGLYGHGRMPVVVVKLGSSIVAEDSGELRLSTVARICEEVAALHAGGTDVVVVTSGAIARGMHLLELPVRPREIAELQAASAMGQGRLYRTYDELLREKGVRSAQVLLTFFDMSARTHYLNARRTLQTLLDWRVVPVINENDTTTTDEISFGDNDFLAAQVAVLLSARQLILLTDTPGVFTADPRVDPAARLIEEITDFEALGRRRDRQRPSPLGSGGMRSKVVAAEMATAAGIETVICSGFEPGAIVRAAAGERGRHALRRRGRSGSPRSSCGCKYAKPSHGRLRVDGGAARALREGGTSLLPVGIVGVEGAFDAGDAVEVVADGARIGKGICQLLGRGARAGEGAEVGRRCARCCRARPRRRSTATTSCWTSLSGHGDRDRSPSPRLPRGEGRVARARAGRSARPRTRRCCAIADALVERTPEILERQRAGPRGGPRGRALRRADGPADARRGARSPASPPAPAPSPRCPTPSARCSTASGCRTASTCAACACRWASSRSSTRRGRT